ncbi:MAG: 3-hydroxybutyryl-CoA dehydrogenase [Firmicutes bacterium]|nr:3-hydroxybutyryl-CoA dehydrogenase [Bacillota bacterium]
MKCFRVDLLVFRIDTSRGGGVGMTINTIGVLGSGVMGGGIAQTAAMAGFTVVLIDVEQRFADNAVKQIESYLDKRVANEKMSIAEKERVLARITAKSDVAGFAEADFVVESVVEDITVKKKVFAEMDQVCRPEVVIATNTSSMSITDIASATNRQERVAGMHFFIPPTIMEIVEIARGYYTSDATVLAVKSVVERMGKKGVVVEKDTPGFIANRVYTPLLLEAFKVYEEGIASREDIDAAMKLAYKLPIGPFELADYIGLDTLNNALEYFQSELGARWSPPQSLKRLVKAGRLGRKTGKGWYAY